ncbi:MAG: DNA polymerase III subunit gamma/tau [Promethearchaeota archaeon]|jgi:DNA polymerase-3 subunit gamma/tau
MQHHHGRYNEEGEMMVFARKYRPKVLDEVIGQPAVVQTLKNSIAQKKLHHAYLFIGKFGCGKTSTARILAASENCKVSPGVSPCGKCDLCRPVFAGTHTDISEIDAASSAGKVEQIRELKNSATFTPIDGAKTKYYIVDEAHRMSAAAEEALLKILEEPPSRVRFILCTTEAQQMRGTILSRCQVHEFKKIYWRQIVQNLENIVKSEKIQIESEALNLCAKLSDGSMRNALQNLEKLVDFAGDHEEISAAKAQEAFGTASDILFYRLVAEISKDGTPDATAGYKIINELMTSGMGASQIFEGISEVLRNILIGVSATACGDLISVSEEAKSRLKEQMKRFKPKMQALVSILRGLVEARTAVEFGQGMDVAIQMWFLDSILIFQKGG